MVGRELGRAIIHDLPRRFHALTNEPAPCTYREYLTVTGASGSTFSE